MIHSFPFYITDWRDSSARMRFSSPEKLLYIELFIYCWKDGFLPADESALLAISGMSPREFRSAWQNVQHEFYQEDGVYRHHKVEEKRGRVESWHESRRANGLKGGRPKASAKPSGLSDVKPSANREAKPSSSSSSSSEENTPPPPSRGSVFPLNARFAEFWAEYPRKTGKGAAEVKYKIACKSDDQHAAIMAGLRAQLAHLRGLDPQFVPHPATWISQKRWLDEPAPQSSALARVGSLPVLTFGERKDQRMMEKFRDGLDWELNYGR